MICNFDILEIQTQIFTDNSFLIELYLIDIDNKCKKEVGSK